MGYVAVSGGRTAIDNAEKFLKLRRLNNESSGIDIEQVKKSLHFLVDRVMGEGSLYAPDLAALAVMQSAGDAFEASFIIRAYRTTLPRFSYSLPVDTINMRAIRRISSAFKDIPGGQYLGPTSDYTLRLLDFEMLEEDAGAIKRSIGKVMEKAGLDSMPQSLAGVIDILRRENLITGVSSLPGKEDCFDITRESLSFPATRSAAMQTMARGETGGMLALAYSNMRGYGSAHPTIGELRVGYVPMEVKHPYNGGVCSAGEILMTEAQIISDIDTQDGSPKFALGYGLCFGHNETKAISMATLDRAMQVQTDEPRFPSEDQEFVLQHIDGIESMGFANHFKLPHYVTFQSALDRLRASQASASQASSTHAKGE